MNIRYINLRSITSVIGLFVCSEGRLMIDKKNYPQKKKQHYPSNQNIANPNIINNKPRYQKGHQNQFVNAFRKTETYYKDKTVIVTESFNMVDFNNDEFTLGLGKQTMNKNYTNRRKK